MIARLHIDARLVEGAHIALAPDVVHYLGAVLRKEAGAAIIVFNASDGEFSAEITALSKRSGEAVVGAQLRRPTTEPDLWLAFSGVKRAAVETIIQKGTELGVSRFAPVLTERTHRERMNLDRLAVIAREAAEQCERLSVPQIDAPLSLDRLLEDWPKDRALLFCDEAGDDPEGRWGGAEGRAPSALDQLRAASRGAWAILIGPEGGFSAQERQKLRAFSACLPVSLGPRILRADTAAIVALTLWQATLGDFAQM